ncbi:Chemotaxis response regulator protein-glutamate methylesterase [Clostridium sp. C105KSO13]|nr:Chemotaxis response regulator protein-glutamate methylesterase [Clostridium sp. C105KSO13]
MKVPSSMLIAVGASTGGTEATLQILRDLPENIPGIVITQHMPEGFTKMYADRLDKLCRMEVREAKDGDIISPGLALIAPGGDLQMKVLRDGSHYRVGLFPGEKISGHRPSVDVLFHSVAETAGQRGVGIILTGMGRDGAQGLLHMRQKGAYTIGQDKDSSVVYGMPMVAHQIGAVCVQAPCQNIAGLLMAYLRKNLPPEI